MILDAVRESGGCATAAEEARLREWMELAVSTEGVSVCPETAACVGALQKMVQSGQVRADQRVVIFNTGAAQKYLEAIGSPVSRIDLNLPIDWDVIEG
jgi:threonine synthase